MMTATSPPPALVAGHARAVILTADGEFLHLATADVPRALRGMPPPLVLHQPSVATRLGLAGFASLDLLELFAFVHPARAAVPTPWGLAAALGLEHGTAPVDPARRLEAEAGLLGPLAHALLDRLEALADTPSAREAIALATAMRRARWSWAESVLARLASTGRGGSSMPEAEAFAIWRRLPAWQEAAARPPPSAHPVAPAESRARLAALLGRDAAYRAGQADYADAAAAAFAPRDARGDPVLLLAEAGTGTGKTLGYVAPASLWAERNGGAVWISTYTRHLQRQIERELAQRLPAASDPQRRRVVVRKGRENYLCLLNLEDELRAARGQGVLPGGSPGARLVPLALLVRWAAATSDGDLLGGDLPGWFRELFGSGPLVATADRRGECIHGACPHYSVCFVEHSIRRARDADLVIANHALVMSQAAYAGGLGAGDPGAGANVPTRYVFDEGHHLAEAADGAFAVALSGIEAAELRRWLLGAEGSRTRARGLRVRLGDLMEGEAALVGLLDDALDAAARTLVLPNWSSRLSAALQVDPATIETIAGDGHPMETLLALLARQALARETAPTARAGSLECDLHPASAGLADAASRLATALDGIAHPLRRLVVRLLARLDDEAETLETALRDRIEAMVEIVRRRALDRIAAWIAMLGEVGAGPPAPGATPVHVSFVRLDLDTGPTQGPARSSSAPQAVRDVALCRHWLDPTLPFMLSLAPVAHGMLVTSATLRDEGGGIGADDPAATPDADLIWRAAEIRAGAPHLPSPALRAGLPSPFDYARQARCLVVTDLAPGDLDALAAAFRTLFLAAGGGGLGLFTAIARLRAVHARIKAPLEAAGLTLLGQHVDAMDNATLVDVFRADRSSCLLGTDAMRDGVDVPGDALRLVVFERVPWMRRDILHRERRLHLSEGETQGFDDRIVRLRLRQAFGRLIRSETDRGVFVLLDRRMPSRLANAFPRGVAVERLGLAASASCTREFLAGSGPRDG